MQVHTLLNEKQKKKITEAAESCNLSVSAFLRMAAKKEINRMGTQINTSQGTNLDNPSTQQHADAGGLHGSM